MPTRVGQARLRDGHAPRARVPGPGPAGEREALDRLLDTARDGRGAVLVVRGGAGLGKTAVLRYAARQASGFHVTAAASAVAIGWHVAVARGRSAPLRG